MIRHILPHQIKQCRNQISMPDAAANPLFSVRKPGHVND
ncbi:uncharacterized protein METZ01_LOCUS287967 [marine metagenome]|uniref:Uncharacterized protein n=1 Tax=marine metagenome TaxID=408172 RepID=A0A382LG06_9ZZZZ